MLQKLICLAMWSASLFASSPLLLHQAIEAGHEAEALRLIASGGSLRQLDGRGNSAFFLAVNGGQENIARALFAKLGPEVLLADPRDALALLTCSASLRCPLSLLQWLGEVGFETGVRDPQTGETALFGAVDACERAKVDWLLGHGAKLSEHDPIGQNILHHAVDRLRARGSEVDLKCRNALVKRFAGELKLKQEPDSAGRTPLEFVRYLQAHPVEWGGGVSRRSFREALLCLQK